MDQQEEADEIQGELTRAELEAKLKEAQERLARYEGYQKLMEETGASQLSITDADAKLMKNKNGFAVAYNAQTAVDSETHLIRDFQMTNQVTDHGLLESTMSEVKEAEPEKIVEVVADKDYEDTEGMVGCLENGIIPHVITDDGKNGYEIEIPYEKSEADLTSTDPEELKKALHAGQIPEAPQKQSSLKGLGNPDLLVLFTGTVSHKLMLSLLAVPLESSCRNFKIRDAFHLIKK